MICQFPGPDIRRSIFKVHFADGREPTTGTRNEILSMLERGELGPEDRVGITEPLRRIADFPAFAKAAKAAMEVEVPISGGQANPSGPVESPEERDQRRRAEQREKQMKRATARRDVERQRASEAAPSVSSPPEPTVAPKPQVESKPEPEPTPDEASEESSPDWARRWTDARRKRATMPRAREAGGDIGRDGAEAVENSKREQNTAEAVRAPEEGTKLFPDEVISLSGMELRNYLLAGSVETILGLPVTSSRGALVAAMQARKFQLDQHRDAQSPAVAQKLGVIDARRIVIAAYELVRDPRTVREYMTASRETEEGFVPFGDFVRFEPTLHDPAALGRVKRMEPEVTDMPAEQSPVSLTAQAASLMDEAEMLVQNLRDRRMREAQDVVDKMTPAQKRRRRRMKQLSASFQAPTRPEGTTTTGPLSYGVGEAKTGLYSVGPGFVALFGLIIFLMLSTTFDQFEGRYDGRSPLAWIRAAAMFVLVVASIRVIRREPLSRLGWKPSLKPGVFSLLLLPALWFLAGFILPFEVKGEPALAAVAVVVVVRAFSEALFFEGLVHRTLLIEVPSAPAAHAFSVAAYVVYMNTYRFLWDPNDPQHAGALLYGLVVALPAAYVFYRTRSWLVSALVRMAALGGTAWASFHALT